MIKSIVIYTPQKEAYFEIGQEVIQNGKKTEIVVSRIKIGKTIQIILSNNQVYEFKGLPYSTEKVQKLD